MQMKLFVLALLCTSILAGTSRVRFQDTKAVLAEMDKDRFGATMISAVQMNMATGNPGEVVELIGQIIDQLENDQAIADDNNRTVQAECDSTISTLTQSIADTKATIDSTEKAITLNQEILTQANTDLKQADQDYEETVEAITTGTAQRNEEHSRWVEEDYENQVSIATLEEGVKLINHMIHGVAFSQIKSRYDKVLEKLGDKESKHSSLFKPLMTSLTQLATKLNYENVMKILDLLNNIRTSIVEERENARLEEEKSQKDWETLLNHLTSEKQRLSDKRARLRSLIDATTTLLAQLRESLESNKVFLEDFEATLATTTASCNEASIVYQTESDERERELAILNKLQDHLKERVNAVQDYLSSRTGPDFF